MGLQKLYVAHRHRVFAPDLTIDPRHRIGMARPVQRGAGIIDIDAIERGGEPVGIAFPANLAIRNDIEAGTFLRPDGEKRRIVLRFEKMRLIDTPEFRGANRGGNRPRSFSRSISQSGCG
jgi:hypothetical protein